MSGMETMMSTLLKAMGFDPQQFIKGTQDFMTGVNNGVVTIANSQTEIIQRLERMERRNDANHIEVVLKLDEIKPSVPMCILEPADDLNAVEVSADIVHLLPSVYKAA